MTRTTSTRARPTASSGQRISALSGGSVSRRGTRPRAAAEHRGRPAPDGRRTRGRLVPGRPTRGNAGATQHPQTAANRSGFRRLAARRSRLPFSSAATHGATPGFRHGRRDPSTLHQARQPAPARKLLPPCNPPWIGWAQEQFRRGTRQRPSGAPGPAGVPGASAPRSLDEHRPEPRHPGSATEYRAPVPPRSGDLVARRYELIELQGQLPGRDGPSEVETLR